MINKIKILLLSLYGVCIKWAVRLKLLRLHQGINSEPRQEKVIVSLTSYGRRVSDVLPYTVFSLLRQTYKPDRIVVWLDCDHWNEENLPNSLKRFIPYGLTVNFCEDIKSYKKLIPALNAYPNDVIITCDDDLFYKKNMVKSLMEASVRYPNKVICSLARHIRFNDFHALASYNEWPETIYDKSGRQVFPLGGSGCLYKKSFLHDDTTDRNLFMSLAPNADDVWFYFMEHLQGTERYVLSFQRHSCIPLDAIYQYLHQGACLSDRNVRQSQNDIQIKAVMDHYRIKADDLSD